MAEKPKLGALSVKEFAAAIDASMSDYRSKYPSLFVAVPGDEAPFGGCLAGGRGFVHISADGDLEACPFAPYSDTNLRDISLREGLQSELLAVIRANAAWLKRDRGGCALWGKREAIEALIPQKNDARHKDAAATL